MGCLGAGGEQPACKKQAIQGRKVQQVVQCSEWPHRRWSWPVPACLGRELSSVHSRKEHMQRKLPPQEHENAKKIGKIDREQKSKKTNLLDDGQNPRLSTVVAVCANALGGVSCVTADEIESWKTRERVPDQLCRGSRPPGRRPSGQRADLRGPAARCRPGSTKRSLLVST